MFYDEEAKVIDDPEHSADEERFIIFQSLRELKEGEIFTFRVAAADTQVDRDFERFSRSCLEKLAELYVGKPFITDHNWSSSRLGAAFRTTAPFVMFSMQSLPSKNLVDRCTGYN